MNWIKNLFSKDNTQNEYSSKFSHLENQSNISFPNSFKKILNGAYNETVIFRLFDADYHLLSSFTSPGASFPFQDSFSQTFLEYNHMHSNFAPMKIVPFARSRFGDGYKYLFFLGSPGGTCGEEIYMQDFDNPGTGNIRISTNTGLISGNVIINGTSSVIDCTSKSVSDLVMYFTLPPEISEFEDGKKTYRSKSMEPLQNSYQISQFASIADGETSGDSHSILHMYIKVDFGKIRYETYNSFELGFPRLKYAIEQNNNHFLFYFKMLSFIYELRRLLSSVEESKKAELSSYLYNLNAQELSKLIAKPFEQIDYLTY